MPLCLGLVKRNRAFRHADGDAKTFGDHSEDLQLAGLDVIHRPICSRERTLTPLGRTG